MSIQEDLKIIRTVNPTLYKVSDAKAAEWAAARDPSRYGGLPARVEANAPADIMNFVRNSEKLREEIEPGFVSQKPVFTSNDLIRTASKQQRDTIMAERVKDVQQAGIIGKGLSFAGGAAQAGTFGGSDEIIGNIRFLRDKARGESSVFGTRDDYIDQARLESDILQKANPATFFTGEVGGVVAQTVATAGLSETAAGTRLTANIGRLKNVVNPKLFSAVRKLAPSAADGFARGFLTSRADSLEDRIKAGALVGGLSAGLTGGLVALGKVPSAIKAARGKVAPIVQKISERAKKSLGISVAKAAGIEKLPDRQLLALNKSRSETG